MLFLHVTERPERVYISSDLHPGFRKSFSSPERAFRQCLISRREAEFSGVDVNARGPFPFCTTYFSTGQVCLQQLPDWNNEPD